jgi:GNAT superfamily N-acetyltransferase
MTHVIRQADSAADYEAFGRLIGEYVDWCRVRYGDEPGWVEATFGHQSLDEELGLLSTAYGAPRGRVLLACVGEAVCGAVAYRRLSEEICEMKRLFVPVRHHGEGLGRLLCRAIMLQAKADGFGLMRLDAAKAFTEARRLYGSMGFVECAPYIDYPPGLKATMVFMEAKLA